MIAPTVRAELVEAQSLSFGRKKGLGLDRLSPNGVDVA